MDMVMVHGQGTAKITADPARTRDPDATGTAHRSTAQKVTATGLR